MSCFEGHIKELKNVSADCFEYSNLYSTTYFLSHCHSDHMGGLRAEAFLKRLEHEKQIYLYCSDITRHILAVEDTFSEVVHKIIALPIGVSNIIPIPDADDSSLEEVTVSLIPTGHCPGAVMFLFEGDMGKILYTGDFRICGGDVSKFRQLHHLNGTVKVIDKLYVDTTFLSYQYKQFPSRSDSIAILCQLITTWLKEEPDNYVYIEVPANYGSEAVFIAVAKSLGMRIHVQDKAYNVYRNIPEIREAVTNDPLSSRIHCCLPVRNKLTRDKGNSLVFLPCTGRWSNLRIIRPCALSFTSSVYDGSLESAVSKPSKEEFIRVCYSSHCSYKELEHFVRYLKPRQIHACVLPYKMNEDHALKLLKEICRWHDNCTDLPILTLSSKKITKNATCAEEGTLHKTEIKEEMTIKGSDSYSMIVVKEEVEESEDVTDAVDDEEAEIYRLIAEDLRPKKGDLDADIRQQMSLTFMENARGLRKNK